MGARVINCSWRQAGGFSQWEQDVITAATQRGALIVAAAGNNHLQNLDESPYYLASYDHVLSVGATTDTSDEIAYFTNIGLSVSVFAPGMRIHVAKDNGSYGTDQGTSHSSPLVAGLAGLLFAAHPDWTPDQVAEQIRMTSDPIDIENPTYAGSLGHGRVNFQRALSEVHSGVVVVAGRFHTPSERTLFVAGDTVILSVKVKNLLPLAAENLSFNVTVDPVLAPLAPIDGPTRLDPGEQDSLTCAFRVGAHWFKQDVKVRLEWSANSSECDAHMFKTTLYIWTKDARNPVFTGVRGTWSANAFTPCVLFNPDSARYEMWFNACPGPTSDDTWRPYSIGRAVSSDGITWSMYPSPVLSPDPGTWDSFTTDAPQVLRENGQYKMWYSSYNNNLPSKPGYLGYATSPDGIHWTKYSGNPVFGPGTADWEAAGPYCCFVVSQQGGYKMWYDGYNLSLTMAKIGYAESSDGINWIRDTVNNPVLGVGGPGQWDGSFVNQPNVVSIGDSSYMWYVGSRSGFRGWTGLAVSKDGRTNWTRCPSNPVLMPTAGTWDAECTCVGAVLLVGDTLHMWYDGWRSPDTSYQYSIGHAWSKVNISSLSVPGGQQDVPNHFILSQNYPNPFNPSTNIKFELPKSSMVRLSVYDILGREVSVLVNERKTPGTYEVSFDGSGLASGVYLYRLTAGSFVQTRKMLVIK